jgi:3-hydroxybutyryl-CoA dehydratase
MTLEVGTRLDPLVVQAVDAARIKVASAILDDPNPIHYDVQHVERLGLGHAPVNHGPLNLGYLVTVAMRFAGGAAGLTQFRGRFLGMVFAGDRVECGGVVTAIDLDRGQATLELTATVAERLVMAGEATVRLPQGP